MPQDWVAKVRHAASQGTEDAILELLEQIPTELSPLASALGVVNGFCFKGIVFTLLQQQHQGRHSKETF